MKRKSSPDIRPLTRKQISRRDKELRARRALIAGTIAVAVVVIGVLAWGLLEHYVFEPRRPVATVNDESISVRDYQALYRFRYWTYTNYMQQLEAYAQLMDMEDEGQADTLASISQQYQQLQMELMQLDTMVLEQLIEDRLVRQAAAEEGITVTEAEIQDQLLLEFGYPVDELDEDMEADFESAYAEWIAVVTQQAGVSEEDVRGYIAGDLYRSKLENQIAADVPSTGEQVRARHILVETEEEAQAAMDRLLTGDAFHEVAAELSIDTFSAESGGDLGWFARGMMVPEFEEAAFSTAPGQMSGIVASDFGYHIILVEEHDPDRELDAFILSQMRDQAVAEWLQVQFQTAEIIRNWSSSHVPSMS